MHAPEKDSPIRHKGEAQDSARRRLPFGSMLEPKPEANLTTLPHTSKRGKDRSDRHERAARASARGLLVER